MRPYLSYGHPLLFFEGLVLYGFRAGERRGADLRGKKNGMICKGVWNLNL